MKSIKTNKQFFHVYFKKWVDVYKVGAIRDITLRKYYIIAEQLQKLVPNLRLMHLDRYTYQQLLNEYALTHEKQTTMDFHHHLKGAILDAIEEGIITKNPTRKIVIKGKAPSIKKAKFLNQFEIQALLKELNLTKNINWDWFILLIAKTGMRFSEALALTPLDFDFLKQKILINKTWNYKKTNGGFDLTKNKSSNRSIKIDPKLAKQFSDLIKNKEPSKPIFIKGRVFNSTVNNRLKILCTKAGISVISLHSLRHTHASMLIFAGVSIASVASRLGHNSISTTQETYLHIIQELENKDNDKIIGHLLTLM